MIDKPEADDSGNDGGDFDMAYTQVYNELKKQASRLRYVDRNVSMLTTDIVNQTYLKLKPSTALRWADLRHFKSIVVLAMRRLLVDLARTRQAAANGGREAIRVPLDEVEIADRKVADYVLDLDWALNDLAKAGPRQSKILELRHFGGLSYAEIAAELDVSDSTVRREMRAAESWLQVRLETLGNNS